MSEIEPGTIEEQSIEKEIEKCYMQYAMSVIRGRALPDVRDGLKPVHRRIMYAQHELGNAWNRAYKKSARVVGDVIGKYHPHGDSAVYDALVRMAQEFNMRLPLVDGQGNFGSVDGDPPAAMRYTEARMARPASEFLTDIDKETVDFIPNYDDTEEEPSVMPTKIPNLLVNGSSGIAVGMATNIPPHNLGEVLDGLLALMKNPSMTIDELMHYIPGPDFPTHGAIYGRKGIVEAYKTGRGIIKVRATASIEEVNGRDAVVVTELPYQVNKSRLLEKIAKAVREKREGMVGIHALRDESDRHGMRIVIELKQDVFPEMVLNQLYKDTAMQSSFGINMLAIVANQPEVLNLKEVLNHFIEFRRDVVTRRTIYQLRKAEEREHILEGYIIALDNIDRIIEIIRSSADTDEARTGLIGEFSLSEIQANNILQMRLQRLTGLARKEVEDELEEVRGHIKEYRHILNNPDRRDEVVSEELAEMRVYSDERRTEIVDSTADIDMEDLIADEDMVVTLSHTNYIKRVPLAEYRAQRRGGRGKSSMSTKDDDFVVDLFVATAHQRIFVFTTQGRVFQLKVWQLPESSRQARGRPIINLLPRLEEDEGIAAVMPIPPEDEGLAVVTCTRNGVVKKSLLEAYQNINVAGLIAVGIRDGDQLIGARLVEDGQEIILATRDGMSIRFEESDVRAMGRTATGVRGVKLRDGDRVIGMEIIRNPDATILTVTENGYGKRTSIEEYRVQNRGGVGIITIKTSDRNGGVVGIRQVTEDDHILLVTNGGTLIRTRAEEISEVGRNTMGVRIIRTDEDEEVVAIARVVEDDEEDEDLEDGDGEAGDGEAGEADAEGSAGDDAGAATGGDERPFAEDHIDVAELADSVGAEADEEPSADDESE